MQTGLGRAAVACHLRAASAVGAKPTTRSNTRVRQTPSQHRFLPSPIYRVCGCAGERKSVHSNNTLTTAVPGDDKEMQACCDQTPVSAASPVPGAHAQIRTWSVRKGAQIVSGRDGPTSRNLQDIDQGGNSWCYQGRGMHPDAPTVESSPVLAIRLPSPLSKATALMKSVWPASSTTLDPDTRSLSKILSL